MYDLAKLTARVKAIEHLLKSKGLASECEINASVNKFSDEAEPSMEFDVNSESQSAGIRLHTGYDGPVAPPVEEPKKTGKGKKATPPTTPLPPDAAPPTP